MALINCPECKKEISNKAASCPNCGCPIHTVQPQEIVNRESEKPEIVLMQGLCNHVKNALLVKNGNGMLTNHRFIYLKHSLIKILVVGALVNLTKGSFEFDIPLDNISSIEDGRQGISKTIVINTKDGKRYNFYFTNREEWKIKLQSAIEAY